MEIKKLLGRNVSGFGSGAAAGQVSANSEVETAQENSEAAKSSGEDTVRVSTLARQLSQISNVLSGDDLERRAKIDAIKKQVEDGTYSIDSHDVARSIIDFAKGEPVAEA